MKIDKNKLKKAGLKTWTNFKKVIPMILGIFLLISFLNVLLPKNFYAKIFSGIPIFDSFIGALLGSISAGHPMMSYMIGGELLNRGVSLIAVIAFILTWVSVGIVQLPAEMSILGKKFALVRNGLSFISAIIIALLSFVLLSLL